MTDQESNKVKDELDCKLDCELDCICNTESEDEPKDEENIKTSFYNENGEKFRILHPDDALMQRFQDALKAHLLRLNDKLDEEICEIKHTLKSIQKEKDSGGSKIRSLEVEILEQRMAIENYQNFFSDVIASREQSEAETEKARQEFKKKSDELKEARENNLALTKKFEQLALQDKWYSTLENEIVSEVSISKRVSAKDAQMQREALREKKQKDYILYKLDEELWKIDSEKKNLLTQLQMQEEDKRIIGQAISDINADLEVLQKELKVLMKNCNLILLHIQQRDEITIEQNNKLKEANDSYKALQLEIDSIKKETEKEMEKSRNLTEMKMNIDEELKMLLKEFDKQKRVAEEMQTELHTKALSYEKCEEAYQEILGSLQKLQCEENDMNKELETAIKSKNDLENQILEKLNESMMQDQIVHSLNKQLHETREKNEEYELLIDQADCSRSKNLLAIQKIMLEIEDEKFNMQELVKTNVEKQKEVEKVQNEVKKCVTNIGLKEAKVLKLKKKTEELIHATKGEEVNVYALKLAGLEKQIDETEAKNQQTCKLWLRQQCHVMKLREQRNAQLNEFSLLTKQLMIIEQKNYKLEYELEKQKKEQNNIERKINELQQSLVQKNSLLAARKDFRQHLEDINYVTRNESMVTLEEAEKELMTLKSEINKMKETKEMLNCNLNEIQLESLSWEKKVQMASQASKIFKEERKGEGDIAMMKSEIHKMEMRLSQLKKVQQKLIQDMEFCIARRENILDRVTAEEKKNPKTEHNRRIIVQKRLDDQRIRIKQMNKEIKHVQEEVEKFEESQKKLHDKIEETHHTIREIEDAITETDKQILEAEMKKNHNLELIIRKQRKASLLLKVKNGTYKVSCKTDINEELQRQKTINQNLKDILHQTKGDFPLLKNEIRKILISLDD